MEWREERCFSRVKERRGGVERGKLLQQGKGETGWSGERKAASNLRANILLFINIGIEIIFCPNEPII